MGLGTVANLVGELAHTPVVLAGDLTVSLDERAHAIYDRVTIVLVKLDVDQQQKFVLVGHRRARTLAGESRQRTPRPANDPAAHACHSLRTCRCHRQ
ncbi:hypothetical protein HRbin41_01608 [bacterium HR41]|nr:hypothetical protein HRbin41_01608 [bacterium HR41]